MNRPFIIRSDASSHGLGACLFQRKDGMSLPCKYASRKLLPREKNYSAVEREALAIVVAIGAFDRYVRLTPFVLQTDHKPLSFVNCGKAKNSRLMRWALALQEYQFAVEAIPGKENHHADLLSRLV